MRTKHLFFTMVLASTFAACTNEDLGVEVPQLSTADARPTVADVTLEFGDVDSRMAYEGGKFNWVDGDKVAVMLMDQNNTGVRYGSSTMADEWGSLTWLERYHLVDYVHTNYPFVLENGLWKTEANMLEGNYFLVYPAAEFDGKRQAYFDISEQKQIGNTAQSRKDAYAKNQRFVGYARLDAAEGSSSLKAQMSEVLAPVRINIESRCTEVAGEPLKINKIVLTHPTFHSQFTIDPTTADYKEWNLEGAFDAKINSDQNAAANGWSYETFFNYANYLTATGIRDSKKELYDHTMEGSERSKDYVWNWTESGSISDKWSEKTEENDRKEGVYYYDEAIRAIVKPLWKENWSENVTKYIEVYTYAENGNDAYTLKAGTNAALGVVAMVPSFNDWESQEKGGLELYIYTNKGLVGPVDLSVKQTGNNGHSVQTTDAILAADPRIDMNTVTVIIDDDDVIATPDNKLINGTDDLENYVNYYTIHPTNSRVDIEITNDVTINDALAAKIVAMKEDAGVDNVSLYISSAAGISKNANVKLAVTAAQADIMNWLDIDDNVLVEVLDGAVVNLTPKARNYMSVQNDLNILVDKGGVLNFKENENMNAVGGWSDVNNFAKKALNTIVENNGTVNIKAKVEAYAGLQLTNNSEVNVESEAAINLAEESINNLNGVINVAKDALLSGTSENNLINRGVINNAGQILDVINGRAEHNPSAIIPGRVVITDANALTTLVRNRGIVEYKVLPTVPVQINDQDYTGVFKYKTTNTNSAELTKHFVSDAEIDGVLTVNNDKTYLRHLTLNDGASIVDTPTLSNKSLRFSDVPMTAATAWDHNTKSKLFITNGNVTLNNVWVQMNDTDYNIVWNNGVVTIMGAQVGMNAASNVADVDLNAVRVTVKAGSNFHVGNFTADEKVTSNVVVDPSGNLDLQGYYDKKYITVSK